MNTDTNKTFIIFGASGGIGKGMTKHLLETGNNVVISSRTKSDLEALAAPFNQNNVLIAPADASNQEQVKDVFRKAVEKFSKVDAVIISIGEWKKLFLNASDTEDQETTERDYQLFFKTPKNVIKIAIDYFKTTGKGLIVNISSHAAIKPELTGNQSYGPMKAAIHHYIKSLPHEFKEHGIIGIRVSDLMPAAVDTGKFILSDEQKLKTIKPEELSQWILEHFDDPNIPIAQLFDKGLVL